LHMRRVTNDRRRRQRTYADRHQRPLQVWPLHYTTPGSVINKTRSPIQRMSLELTSQHRLTKTRVQVLFNEIATTTTTTMNMYVRLRRLTYVYPHMPIPRPHAARFHERRIHSIETFTSVMFTRGWAWPARWPIRPILGLWWSRVHNN